MASVTEEQGIYDDQGTPQELHCRAFVTYDDVTRVCSRIESWENTYPFAWSLTVIRAAGPLTTTIPANNVRGNRLNLPAGILIDNPWSMSRAAA